MRKSKVIASCLVNANIIGRLEDAELAVEHLFSEEFPASNFADWNQNIDDRIGEEIIARFGRASQINVKSFIQELW